MDKSQKHDFKNILFIFRERGREEERERNIHQSVASCTPPTGDLAQNPGMCPDWESNGFPLGLWDNAQPTEPQQSGMKKITLCKKKSQVEKEYIPYGTIYNYKKTINNVYNL